jgi:hypothetical protein
MKIFLLLLSILISQYSYATEKKSFIADYKNPMTDLQSAIDKKDYRFIAISGVGITGASYIHGIKESAIKDEHFPFPKKYINGDGCVVTPMTDAKYKYMIKYNKSLVKYLKTNNLLDDMEVSKIINSKQKKIIIK